MIAIDQFSVISMLQSIIAWFDLTKTLSVAGFCVAVVSLYFTWQNRRLVLAQERRRLPCLLPTLVHGYYRDGGDGRIYAFRLTVANPTDSNNAIATAELSVTYLTLDRLQMTMKLQANEPGAKSFMKDQEEVLAIPAAISAHNAVSGWLRFHVPTAMLTNRDIEGYRLTLTDAHGETASVVPARLRTHSFNPSSWLSPPGNWAQTVPIFGSITSRANSSRLLRIVNANLL